MGQESIGIDNLKRKNQEKQEKKTKKDISFENKMQIREFLDFLKYEKGSSKSTADGYNRDLVQFFLFVEKNYDEIEERNVFEYIEYINEKLKKNSVSRKVSAIKTFYKFCYLNKAVKKDPAGMVKSLKREHRLPEILTLEEMKKIIDNCPSTPEGMQNMLIIKFLIATGARISEILNLEIKDLENKEYEFIKVLGKDSKYRIVPIYENFENEIKNYLDVYRLKLKNAKNSFKIFPNTRREKFWKDLKIIAKDARIEKNVYPHIFKYSIAAILFENSVDISIVQEILGHATIITAEVYPHFEKDELKMIYNNIKLGDD